MSREHPTGPELDEATAVIRGALQGLSSSPEAAVAALDFFDPEVEVQDYVGMIDAEWHFGHEGVSKWAVKIWQAVGKVRVTPSDFVEAPDGRIAFSGDVAGERGAAGTRL